MQSDLEKIIEHIPDPIPETDKLPVQSIDPLGVCQLFYKLVFLDQTVGRYDDDRYPLTKLKKEYDSRLAVALRDYSVLTVAGELRHVTESSHARKFDLSCKIEGFSNSSNRHAVMVQAINYIPKSIINTGIDLFDAKKYAWCSAFGGSSWHRIAKAADLFGSVSNERFIDLAWNLRHNGNLFFNKGTIFMNEDRETPRGNVASRLRDFLTNRAAEKADAEWTKSRLSFSRVMGEHREHFKQVMDYVPIKWGEKEVVVIYTNNHVRKPVDQVTTFISPLLKRVRDKKKAGKVRKHTTKKAAKKGGKK